MRVINITLPKDRLSGVVEVLTTHSWVGNVTSNITGELARVNCKVKPKHTVSNFSIYTVMFYVLYIILNVISYHIIGRSTGCIDKCRLW